MKSLMNKVIITILGSVLLWGCTKDDALVKIGNSKPGTLSTSSTNILLSKATMNNNAITITFTPADFGFNAAITNTIEIAKNGTNFQNPKTYVLNAGEASKSLTGLELNSIALSLNLAAGVSSQMDIRLKSSVNNNINTYSTVKTISVTPFEVIEYAYLAGDYQGWNPDSADTLTSATGNGIFKGTVQFNSASQFKVLRQRAWGSKPGEQFASSSSSFANPATLVIDGAFGNPVISPTTNQNYPKDNYLVELNLNSNTLSFTLETWGITGDATPKGWPTGDQIDNDTIMKYSNKDGKWYLIVTLKVGKMQFRRNHSWNGQIGKPGGGDIEITSAGNYAIALDAVARTYTITKLN